MGSSQQGLPGASPTAYSPPHYQPMPGPFPPQGDMATSTLPAAHSPMANSPTSCSVIPPGSNSFKCTSTCCVRAKKSNGDLFVSTGRHTEQQTAPWHLSSPKSGPLKRRALSAPPFHLHLSHSCKCIQMFTLKITANGHADPLQQRRSQSAQHVRAIGTTAAVQEEERLVGK